MYPIHVHPKFKIGRRPRDPSRPSLKLKSILSGVVPDHPLTADHLSNVSDFGLYQNDQFGDCGPTSVANQLKLVTKYLFAREISPTQVDVFDLYRRSGNPSFDPVSGVGDDGVEMSVMLSALNKGGISGIRSLAFAEVDLTNSDEIKAAIAIFGSVLFGADLQVAQQGQTDAGGPWDYVPGSAVWGGHAFLGGAYDQKLDTVITWAQRIGMTEAFVNNQIQRGGECWAVIWPYNLGTQQFQQGIDLGKLAAAYKALTGKTWPLPLPPPAPKPVPVPPTPTPDPTPVPTPTPIPPAPVPPTGNVFVTHGKIMYGPFPDKVHAKAWAHSHFGSPDFKVWHARIPNN